MIVYVAADGSTFNPVSCRRAGGYWIGPKGAERKFTNYDAAFDALRKMSVPYWRRPNPRRNWGIVKGRREFH